MIIFISPFIKYLFSAQDTFFMSGGDTLIFYTENANETRGRILHNIT